VVWCGVVLVWCDVVWCGVGVVWCGVVWCWCGVVLVWCWCGVVWCGVVWCYVLTVSYTGDKTVIALTELGMVFSWGIVKGLHFPFTAGEPYLMECLLPYFIISIAAGSDSFAALTAKGRVLTW